LLKSLTVFEEVAMLTYKTKWLLIFLGIIVLSLVVDIMLVMAASGIVLVQRVGKNL
jgi:hypothetical protein